LDFVPFSCTKHFDHLSRCTEKLCQFSLILDPGFWILDVSSIQYQASSICPENATILSIPAMPVEKILCDIVV
jgi:hypothetical protein